MMTALLLHAYVSGLYSSRRIAEACIERADLMKMIVFSAGFLFGMIAMYIAMHLYRDNIWPWLSS